jgi:hypothetical protein
MKELTTGSTYDVETAGTEEEYKELTKLRTPDKIRDDALQYFMETAGDKFNAGQEEHGGSLDERVSEVDIDDEIIDLWFYVQSFSEKHRVQIVDLCFTITKLEAEVERWKERAQR